MQISSVSLVSSFSKNRNYNQTKSTPTFTAGLTDNFIKYVEQIDTQNVEKNFKLMGISANFEGNKIIAACCEKVAKLFRQAGLFPLFPTKISTGTLNENTLGECSIWTREITFNKNYFEEPSNSISEQLLKVSQTQDVNKLFMHSSSNNFLHTFFHEFGHAIHLANITDKNKPDQAKYIFFVLNNIKLPIREIAIQESGYATTDTMEFVAENIARRFSLALNKNLDLKYNPIEFFKDKNSLINEPITPEGLFRYRLFNAIWNGNIEELTNIFN